MVSVISSLGAPLINTVAASNKIPLSTAQWILTATLLTSAIATPIMGRLADGPRQRRVVLAGLSIVIIGLIISALSKNFMWLLLGRCLQGVGMGITPVVMSIARNQLDAPTSTRAIATLSVTTSAFIGLGYPATSFITEKYNYHVAFWCAAVLVAISFCVSLTVIPKFAKQPRRRFDLAGAVLLSIALIGILTVLGEGEIWGWTSTRSLSFGVGGSFLMIIWILYTLRKKDALINLHQLSARPVIAVNLSAFLICLSMYMFVPLIVEFVQIPKSTGIGFSSSILTSGLLLVPLSVTMLISSRFIPFVMRRFSARVVIPLGCTVFAIASLYFAVEHSHLWQAFLASSIAGIGMGFTFAAMPSYIVRSVPGEETGAALGLYQLIQRIGLSIGSAAAGAMLAHFTIHKEPFPSLRGFTTILYLAFVMLILTAIASYFLLGASSEDASPTKAEQSVFEP